MRLNLMALVLMALWMAGCSGPKEPEYASVPEAMQYPAAGKAQLIFYYPRSFFWKGTMADIDLGGQFVCGLKSGTFAIKNVVPSPRIPIAVSLCSSNGTARVTLNAQPNKKYFIRIVPNDQTFTGIYARRGLSGIDAWAATMPEPPGTPKEVIAAKGVFWISLIDESTALEELQGLTLCPQCI